MGSKGRKRGVVVDSRYQPTKEELEEDVSIDASPEDVARSLFPVGPSVVESVKGEGSSTSNG